MTAFTGKRVLLTGGTAGIGEQMALQLQAAGAEVIVTGRDLARLASMQDRAFAVIEADLSSPSGADRILAALGDSPLDMLVNNAGQGADHDFREGAPDIELADACIYANLNTPIRLIAALLPRLRERKTSAIVNVTSGLAIAPRSGGPVYCATKAGLRSYTQAIRAQLAGTDVLVVEALPPIVDTQMTAGRGGRKMSAEACAREILDGVAAGREEIAVGMVKILRAVHSASPALARRVMLRY